MLINPNFKSFITLLITFWLTSSCWSQDVQPDSVIFVKQVNGFLEQKKYASAHLMLEEYLQQNGMKPFFTCWMVSNGLTNYYRHENYDFFYLKDLNIGKIQSVTEEENPRIIRLRYPQRLLEKIIQGNPKYALAYKLLGDYYDLQLRDLSHFDFAKPATIRSLEEKIFTNYSQADKLGLKNDQLNRWMGDYYLNRNQLDLAETYYQKNSRKVPADGISLYRLAEISFQKKLYTQAYNYATEALKNLSAEEVYLKYDALLLSANALQELGEFPRFLETIQACIDLLPDLPDAYLALIEYHEAVGDSEKVALLFQEMLLKNPYELEGYRKLESYVVNSGTYSLADSLFEMLLLQYENWDEVLANIYWSKGNLAFYRKSPAEANNFWEISRNYMRRYLPENHLLIRQVGDLSQKK
jgi:tetratricopeptide (TPR) repeat protein